MTSALRAARFQFEHPAVVSWMGVVYYLAKGTVAKTLAELASLLAPRSAVALDYQLPLDALPQRYRDIFGRVSDYLKGVGEPQVNRYRPEELRDAVLSAGFARVELPTRDEIRRRYVEPLGSRIPMSERFGLAIAWR